MIHLINGPNLNMLGVRNPEIYGTTTLNEIENRCTTIAKKYGFDLICKQSNHEGQLIDWIHEILQNSQGLIINPGALSHTSLALADAIAMIRIPVIEVHLSNIYKREPIRHHSLISAVATATIAGFGPSSYVLAVEGLVKTIERSEHNERQIFN
jgi:3-dehydroquinate dehydratase-2